MNTRTPRLLSRRLRRAFSLIEVALSTVTLAFVTVAAARTVAGARASDQLLADRAQGRMLADALMSEILLRAYVDPQGGTGFGTDAGENQATRTTLDDIDDFSGYSEAAIKNPDGSAVASLSTWSRTVTVQWVSSSDFTSVIGAETDVKRITITVKRSGRTIIKATAIRCRGRDAIQ